MRPAAGVLGALAAVSLLLAGCGEKEPVVVYKQGKYQGKADQKPWDNEKFKGNQAEWEKELTARNQGQNEYLRTARGG